MSNESKQQQFLDNAFSRLWDISSTFEKSLDPEAQPSAVPDFSKITSKLGKENAMDTEISRCDLPRLEKLCSSCRKCKLAQTRTNVVFGTGCTTPLLMVVGEGPGFHEDQEGLPFVGEAGKFLDKWLASIHLSRQDSVYICNVIKCRPPQNRDPQEDEISACQDYLVQQINLLKPRLILGVGKFAAQFLMASDKRISELRGTFKIYHGIPAICTYHPAAVLRNLEWKRPVWEDLKKVAAFLEIPLK